MKAKVNSLETSFKKGSFLQNIQKEIPDVLPRFFDLLLPTAFSFGGIALAVSLYRSIQYGWYSTLTLHAAMYLFSLLILLFRRRIPGHVLFFVFFGLMFIGSFHSLYTMGLAGEGMMTLSLLCVFTGLFFGIRAGIITLFIGITTSFFIGTSICTGMISINPEVIISLRHPSTWLMQLALFLMFVVPLVQIMHHIHKKMAGHLHDSREMNTRLQKEISARSAAEIKLEESEHKYRSVVENSFVAFYIVQEGVFRFVNSRFLVMTGYTQDELIDKLGPMEITHHEDRQKISENIRRRLAGEEVKSEYESRLVRKDGSVVIVKVMGNLFSFNGKPAIFGALIDTTNEKLLESKLIQSQKMEAVGTLAGGIAHDFNNILSALVGFSTMLHMALEDNNPLKRYATNILAASEKAAGLTQSLLTFSRAKSVELKPVNISSMIKDTEDLLRRIITEDIDVRIDLSPAPIYILSDVIQINQILFNLAANARDAMPRGGRLEISTDVEEIDEHFIIRNGFGKKGRYCRISISDSGVGMEKATIDKIFDPFFTTKEIGKGTGLGLSTVYGIVKQHRGYIRVSSTVGGGTSFHIYFPVIDNYSDIECNPPKKFRRGDETILVAEDDTTTRCYIRDLLSHYGYQVIEAKDGEDAIRKFKSHKEISLVILDYIMPVKNGKEVYNAIKKERPDIRALFMSGYPEEIVLSKGLLEPAMEFLAKPLYPDKLLEKVGEILDRGKENTSAYSA